MICNCILYQFKRKNPKNKCNILRENAIDYYSFIPNKSTSQQILISPSNNNNSCYHSNWQQSTDDSLRETSRYEWMIASLIEFNFDLFTLFLFSLKTKSFFVLLQLADACNNRLTLSIQQGTWNHQEDFLHFWQIHASVKIK